MVGPEDDVKYFILLSFSWAEIEIFPVSSRMVPALIRSNPILRRTYWYLAGRPSHPDRAACWCGSCRCLVRMSELGPEAERLFLDGGATKPTWHWPKQTTGPAESSSVFCRNACAACRDTPDLRGPRNIAVGSKVLERVTRSAEMRMTRPWGRQRPKGDVMYSQVSKWSRC